MEEAAPDVDALIAGGRYQEAAAALAKSGELMRAQALLEKVWDWQGAAAVARTRGDRVAELRLLLDGKHVAGAGAVHAAITAGGSHAERAGAAEVCERKRMWREAARLREALGEAALARTLYERAGLLLDAGRLDERLGRFREAGMAYERFLRGRGETKAPHANDATDEQSRREGLRATLALGRVLAILGRHEEAVRRLQAAFRDGGGGGGEAGRAGASGLSEEEERAGREHLVASLAALGMESGARAVLEALQAQEARKEKAACEARHVGSSRSPLEAGRMIAELEEPEEPETLSAFLGRRRRETGGDLLAGRYAVERLLGSGGMGRVYLARDRLTDEHVAVKVVAPPADPRVREGYRRFLREAEAVALLSHPNLVTVREVRKDEGLLVMEYMQGGTVEGRLAATGNEPGAGRPTATGLPPRIAQALLAQLVRGLGAAHARGVIHRDIKPSNIFLSLTGEAKLGDFGVAHLQDLGATQTAGFIGTLAYMSPEQITAAPLTFACDLYALGITAFQMLTGRLPFEGPDFVGAHLATPAPAPSTVAPALGTAFDGLVLRLLEKNPHDRHASLDALLRELEAIRVEEDPLAAPGAALPLLEPAAAPPAGSEAARYRIEADLGRTPLSSLHRAVDERLGRPVIVERFDEGCFEGEAGAARLGWLRTMARHGGPHLQRVLRLDRAQHTVVYEAVLGTPAASLPGASGGIGVAVDPISAARLVIDCAEALAGPHREGVGHGDVFGALVIEASGATLTVAGRLATHENGSHGPPARARDLADLRRLVERLENAGGGMLGDDIEALARWARERLPG